MDENMKARLERVQARLSAMSPAELAEFDRRRDAIEAMAHRPPRASLYEAYTANRPPMFAEAHYGMLAPDQDQGGRITHWWQSGLRGLLLAGPPGRGKTLAAYTILNAVAAASRDGAIAGLRVDCINAVEWEKLTKPVEADATRDEVMARATRKRLDRLAEADLLLLDDLTKITPTKHTNKKLYELLNTRVERGLRTVYTMNVATRSPDDFRDAVQGLDPATIGRLKEDTALVFLDGREWRKFATAPRPE